MKPALLHEITHESPREAADNGLRRRTPSWRSHSEMTRQRPSDSDSSVIFLIEVAFREPRLRQPYGESAVYARSDRFDGVIGEGCSTGGVRMKDADARVEPGSGERDRHLTCKNGI